MAKHSWVPASLRRLRLVPEFRRLRDAHPRGAQLSASLAHLVHPSFTPEEQAWVSRIEARRRVLEQVTDVIDIVDCGAMPDDCSIPREALPVVRRVVGPMCRSSSKSCFWAGFLFRLIREWRPSTCLELGTCMGISALYQAAALRLNGPAGRLVTVEGSDSLAAIAREGFRELGLPNATCVTGCFQQVLPGLLQDAGRVDFAFIDGHHEEEPTLRYFEWISAHVAADALLVFDDISWSAGMQRAWRKLCQDSRLCLAVDTGILGVCVAGPDDRGVQEFRILP